MQAALQTPKMAAPHTITSAPFENMYWTPAQMVAHHTSNGCNLLPGDLLGSDTWPDAYFVASRLRFEEGRLAEVRGEFTLRGISQPLSLTAVRYRCRVPTAPEPADASEICGGDFEGEFKRSDFGITFGLPFVGDRVRLRVQVEGRR